MFSVVKRDGSTQPLEPAKLRAALEAACGGLNVSVPAVLQDCQDALYDGVTTDELDRALVGAAKGRVHLHPDYSKLAARLFRVVLMKQVGLGRGATDDEYRAKFVEGVGRLTAAGVLSAAAVARFDLTRLAAAIRPDRDDNFYYLGIKTAADGYLKELDGKTVELPQAFWMRVAMGLAVNEGDGDRDAVAVAFYDMMSSGRFCPSTPTLFNALTPKSQLSSCYLSTLHDSVDGIYGGLHQQARLSKFAGGLGVDGNQLRAANALIRGTNGKSRGVVYWMKQLNDLLVAVDQGGKRRGSGCFYLQTWHLDAFDFIAAKESTGDERRRCHDLNTAFWHCDEFFRRVEARADWTLLCPSECPELNDLWGPAWEAKYRERERQFEAGLIRGRRLPAVDLWRESLKSMFETGHPWATFRDAFNFRYTDGHAGIIKSSNLCCVVGSDRVVTQHGILRVDELAAVNSTSPQAAVNIVAGRGRLRQASAMSLTVADAETVRVRTVQGYEHTVTLDHPLWVVGEGWREAKDLKPGDRVELQSATDLLWGPDENADLALLAGLIAGDGTFCGDDSVRIDLWLGKLDQFEEEVLAAYGRVTGDTTRVASRNGLKVSFASKALCGALNSGGMSRENKLRVPPFVWRGTRDTVAAYLRGLYLSDGTVQATAELTASALSSVSRELLADVQILLANFGIRSSLRKMRGASTDVLPDGRGGLKEYPTQTPYRLLVTSVRANRKLESLTGLGAARGNHQYLANIQKSGYAEKAWAEVESVEPAGRQDTYCLMVDAEDRAWTCNGLITKNTEIGRHAIATRFVDEFTPENPEETETACCNLSSVNLPEHVAVVDGVPAVDYRRLAETIRVQMRALDNVVDTNFYPTVASRNSNLRYRPVGLGQMGWADLLYRMGHAPDSPEAVALADRLNEFISYHAIMASIDLAAERGRYPRYEGSTWSRGVLPIDTFEAMFATDGIRRPEDRPPVVATLDWDAVRRRLAAHGIRNGSLLAVAPTATIANLNGCSQGVDVPLSVVFTASNMRGDFLVLNRHFVADAERLGVWSDDLARRLVAADGDVAALPDLPAYLRDVYRTAFDVDQAKNIEVNAVRQAWVDQAVSFNLYVKSRSLRELSDNYMAAWRRGLKSTYYLHTKAISTVEKSVGATAAAPTCRVDNPGCESCQ